MFTARYALSPYIKQTNFVFKGSNVPVKYGVLNTIADATFNNYCSLKD
jgi:hypothetical protein